MHAFRSYDLLKTLYAKNYEDQFKLL